MAGNDLFVTGGNATSGGVNAVGEYNATTGALVNSDFVTGVGGPDGLAVGSVPEPSTWTMVAVGGVALLGMMLRKRHRTA